MGSGGLREATSMQLEALLKNITPEIYEAFQRAIEVGKWPDGKPLTDAQKETCLQAIIVYDSGRPETHRTGYVPPKKSACAKDDGAETPLHWR